MLDLNPVQVSEVQRILHAQVSDYRVCAFGSRVTGKAGRYSDLDLVVMGDKPLGLARLADLKEAFSASNLPFMVDVLDWASTTESFRRFITPQLALVQEAHAVERDIKESE